MIKVLPPGGSSEHDVPEFIQQLAHEVTHAANFVGARAPTAQTLVAEIKAGIQEEIATRQSEATILGEVRAPKGQEQNKKVQEQVAQVQQQKVASRLPPDVERNIAPASSMTYVENFFFERRLRDAKANDKITDDQAREFQETISQAVQNGLGVPDYFGEYGRVWRDRETVKKEWAEFHQTHRPTDPGYDAAKEPVLQDHARRFFGGQVAYQARATP